MRPPAPAELSAQPAFFDRDRGRFLLLACSTLSRRAAMSSSTAEGPPEAPVAGSGAAGGYRPGRVGYSTTKAALERITTGLAAEVYDDGIAVNSLAPVAAVRTPGAEVHLGPLLDERPEIVEPVELIAEAAVAIEFHASAEDIARSAHAHPTYAEALKEAALAVGGHNINI